MSSKRLHEMNDLRDMRLFPISIYAGATGNVLASITATWFINGWYKELWLLWLWAVGLVGLNILPVVLLRWFDSRLKDTPPIGQMNFFRDQHRFATWVYAVAAGNMFFWIVTAWVTFSFSRDIQALGLLLIMALVITTFPAWIRPLCRSR